MRDRRSTAKTDISTAPKRNSCRSLSNIYLLTWVNVTSKLDKEATGKMRMCGRADLRILERVRVKIMDLD